MLILFDIDGTLLLTGGAGIGAMADAGRALYGQQFTIDGVEFSGRLDPLIWKDLIARNCVPLDRADHELFRRTYSRMLEARLRRNSTAQLLPGVAEFVAALQVVDGVSLGLLTGNYPETGRLKIKTAGLDPEVFRICAWGCDAESRRDLTPLAIDRHAQLYRSARLGPHHVVVIGDTPHDVDCAKAHGCRSIAVATGRFSRQELLESGADLALENLAATSRLLDRLWEWKGGVRSESSPA
jgi:phosphoglycolate phosphatase